MANPEHLAILKQGVPAWNKWRSENPFATPDLREENLRYDLLRADLITPEHHEAEFYLDEGLGVPDLRGADLNWANLHGSSLRGADLYEANLHMASLTAADLGEANLAKADLTGANLRGADLSNSDFTGARVGWTVFGNNDFSTVKGLDSVYHQGPSIIGIETIYRSKGRVSEAFLRRAGVPEDFVVYMRSLVAKPIEFYSCFISYSTTDQEFADQLCAGLQARGVRCWFAPHDIQAGRKIHEQIDVEIGRHEKLLLIL